MPYIDIIREHIEAGRMSWQQGFDWLSSHGMRASYIRRVL